ncbi:iron-containing alcohol dehydrogenase [Novispirillum sp. DQ9]|uniref:iron-containing alcohol dehydrogenase n=1 Tax=Novispirillum sp. DQ9 TaxID=3398612 RepID=UPI003C7E3A1C
MDLALLTPTRIITGGGSVRRVPEVLKALGCSRPLVVTDPFLSRSPLLDRLTAPLDAAGVRHSLYPDCCSDPTTEEVRTGVEIMGAGDFDCLIAFGGGSPMDTAKAMNILYAGGGEMRDWKVPKSADLPVLPLVCVPTTAGTGAEVTKFCVITDAEGEVHEKMLIMGSGCLPDAAVIDYELTLDLPARITADTGIDAITHALEAYVSVKANPYSDALALAALGQLYPAIRTAVRQPHDHAARAAMMLGATLAGLAFSNASVALVHGMSRPIGAFFHVPHGLSNAMLLPAVTAFSAQAAPGRYAAAARAMGCAPRDGDDAGAVACLLASLAELNTDLEVPTPRAWGIDEARFLGLAETMAAQALASGSPNNNPRVPTVAEITALYRECFG